MKRLCWGQPSVLLSPYHGFVCLFHHCLLEWFQFWNQHTLSHSWLNTNCVRCMPMTIKKYLRFSVNKHSWWSIKWEQSRTWCRVRYIGTWCVCPCWRDTDSCTGDRTAAILHRTCCSRPPALGWSRRQTGCELFLCDGSRSAGPKLGLILHNIQIQCYWEQKYRTALMTLWKVQHGWLPEHKLFKNIILSYIGIGGFILRWD